jgi:hypothetical protein
LSPNKSCPKDGSHDHAPPEQTDHSQKGPASLSQ